MSYVDIHDNSIDEMTRKRSYAQWLIENGEDEHDARVRAHQRITLIVAKDENLPNGKRRQAWVSYYISAGYDEMTARQKACKRIPR